MLWNASAINGYAISASDGRIGTVSDFLFDDASWRVRWLVVDTGHWLTGRKVLLPPSVLGHPDVDGREFAVRLTKQQIKDSPEIDGDRPVSRQMESHVYDYYGWYPYWGTGIYMGGSGILDDSMTGRSSLDEWRREEHVTDARQTEGDPHLRSIEAVTGYHIHATDGAIGHIEDFLLGDTDWSIHYLIVDTKNWWPGKLVLIAPRLAQEINWTHRRVTLDVDRQKVKDSPLYDATTTVDGAYERHFHSYYGEVRPTGKL